jgi:hypothetical protein
MNTSGAGALGPLPTTFKVAAIGDQVVSNPQFTAFPLQLNIPANSPLEGQRFAIYASGRITTGVSSTGEIKLWSGTSLTPASNTLLGDSGAVTAFGPATVPWFVNADVIFDSVSGHLNGTVGFTVGANVVAAVALSNVVANIKNTNNPVLTFVLSVAFGTANAGNSFTVQEFAVNF